jgi:hypothetical protein
VAKKQQISSFEETVAASFLEDLEKTAARIASEDGDPPGADRLGEAEAVRLWGQTDPQVDHDRLLSDLMTTGVDPAVVQNLAISKTRPEWAELYTQPVQDSEMAAQLAALAQHPFRAGLVLDYSPEPEEQVKRSDHLHALWEKQNAAQEAELYGAPEALTLEEGATDAGPG